MPYAESIGTFKELQDEGKVRWVGISNATVAQLEEALGIVDVVSVQNQLSLALHLADRQGRAAGVHRARHRLPAVVAAGRHRLGGRVGRAASTRSRPRREAHGVSPQQVALAWLLSLGPTVIPIPGSSRPETITDSLRAAELELTDAELSGDLGGGRRRLGPGRAGPRA